MWTRLAGSYRCWRNTSLLWAQIVCLKGLTSSSRLVIAHWMTRLQRNVDSMRFRFESSRWLWFFFFLLTVWACLRSSSYAPCSEVSPLGVKIAYYLSKDKNKIPNLYAWTSFHSSLVLFRNLALTDLYVILWVLKSKIDNSCVHFVMEYKRDFYIICAIYASNYVGLLAVCARFFFFIAK